MKNNNYELRKFVIGGVAVSIVIVYLIRLFTLQLWSDDYKKNADSNAFRKDIQYPSRGLIMDRKGRLLVYNEPSYNIMVVMNDQRGVDTLDFCRTVGITREEYEKRMADIKNRNKNPGYSRYTPQLFMAQIPAQEFSLFREKLFRFNGFSIEKRTTRQYTSAIGAHLLGDVGEVNEHDIEEDPYYKSGDYIGKLGIERSYEKQLRGEKGMRIMLRDVHGRTQGHYQDGKYDKQPQPGKNLTLGIDRDLQALAERLLTGKLGAIVAIEPKTGEVLCLASSPIPLVPAIGTSCNSYFCWNLYRMHSNRHKYGSVQKAMTKWKDYMVAMGFGYKLGIDLPGEKRGMIPNADYYDKAYHKSWNGLTVISIAIGQGEVTATPLQIANLAATVANRGYFITPHVVHAVQDGRLAPEYYKKRYTGVDRRWYEYVVAGMRKAVLDGTCRGADIPGYEVCGKTGTAQNRGHDHSAFMGFAPMNDPRIAVAVYVENGGFGNVYGVPIGALIMEQYLNGKLSEASLKKAEHFQNMHIKYPEYER